MSCDGESIDSLFEESSREIKSESLEDNELNKHSKGLHELISTLEENTKEDIKILNETLKNINQKIKTYRDEVKKAQIDINNINSKGESFKAESFKKDIETLKNEVIKLNIKLENMTEEYEKNDETLNNIKAALENSKRKTDS